MTCCLTAPRHNLNQCWLFISEVMWHSPESNFWAAVHATTLYNEFENYTGNYCHVCQDQWVDNDQNIVSEMCPRITYDVIDVTQAIREPKVNAIAWCPSFASALAFHFTWVWNVLHVRIPYRWFNVLCPCQCACKMIYRNTQMCTMDIILLYCHQTQHKMRLVILLRGCFTVQIFSFIIFAVAYFCNGKTLPILCW